MSAVFAFAWLDRRILRREPLAVIATFAMPFLLVLVLAPIYVAGDGGTSKVALVLAGDGPVTRLYEQRLLARSDLSIVVVADEGSAARAARRQDVGAAIIVPAEIDNSGASESIRLLGPPGIAVPSGVRSAVEHVTAETAAIVAVARVVAPEDPLGRGLDEASEQARPALARAEADVGDPEGRRNLAQAAAVLGVVVLFTFLNTAARSSLLVGCDELGVLARARSMAIPTGRISAGFTFGLASYAVVQALLVLAGATVLIGVSWPRPALLALVVIAVGLAAGGMGTLIGTLLRTSSGGVTIAAPLAFVLAMVGGCLWPLEIVGPTLQAIGHLTPHAWAIDALHRVVEGSPASLVLRSLLVLGAFGLGALAAAGFRIRSRLDRAS
ncbi:MAG: ABC transporter permease [Aquihabitans sp.]